MSGETKPGAVSAQDVAREILAGLFVQVHSGVHAAATAILTRAFAAVREAAVRERDAEWQEALWPDSQVFRGPQFGPSYAGAFVQEAYSDAAETSDALAASRERELVEDYHLQLQQAKQRERAARTEAYRKAADAVDTVMNDPTPSSPSARNIRMLAAIERLIAEEGK